MGRVDPKSFDAMIQGIVQQAAVQTEARWKDWTDALAEHERLVLATHMAFALLDVLLSGIARKMLERQLPVHLARWPPQLRIETPMRGTVATATLQDDRIQIDFFGRDVAGWRHEWRARDAAPSGVNLGPILETMQDVAGRIARHLTAEQR